MKSLEILSDNVVAYEVPLLDELGHAAVHFLAHNPALQKIELSAQATHDYLAAIVRIGSDWVIMQRPNGTRVVIDQTPVVALKALRDNDAIHIGDVRLRYKALDIQILTAEAEMIRAEKRCPWCGVAFKPGDQVIVCPGCRTPHHYGDLNGHLDCWGTRRCGGGLPCDYKLPRRARTA